MFHSWEWKGLKSAFPAELRHADRKNGKAFGYTKTQLGAVVSDRLEGETGGWPFNRLLAEKLNVSAPYRTLEWIEIFIINQWTPGVGNVEDGVLALRPYPQKRRYFSPCIQKQNLRPHVAFSNRTCPSTCRRKTKNAGYGGEKINIRFRRKYPRTCWQGLRIRKKNKKIENKTEGSYAQFTTLFPTNFFVQVSKLVLSTKHGVRRDQSQLDRNEPPSNDYKRCWLGSLWSHYRCHMSSRKLFIQAGSYCLPVRLKRSWKSELSPTGSILRQTLK